MDRVTAYKEHAANIIKKYAAYKPINLDVNCQAVVDHEGGHYQLMSVGWQERNRIHNCIIHIDVIDDKLWIQEDATDVDIANELVAQGVPKEDILLAFHPPYKRPYTGFGLN